MSLPRSQGASRLLRPRWAPQVIYARNSERNRKRGLVSLSCPITASDTGGRKGLGLLVHLLEDARDPRATQPERPGLSAGAGAAKIGRERRTPEAVTGRARGFRASCASGKWGGPGSRFRPKPFLHGPHPVWSPTHLTSFILTKISRFLSERAQKRTTSTTGTEYEWPETPPPGPPT